MGHNPAFMPFTLTMLAAALLWMTDPPAAAPPEPPPIPPAGAPASGKGDAPVAPPSGADVAPGATSTATPSSAPVTAPPRRLWVILDYYKEFGGTVLREDEASITLVTPEGDERKVDRNSIINAVPLLDDPEGTKVVVRMRDGGVLRGELVSDGFQAVKVRIGGVSTTLPRNAVFALQRELPFETRLANFRSRIAADDWGGRLELSRWLLSEGRPDLALEELRTIRKKLDSEEVDDLIRQAETVLKLRGDGPKEAPAPKPAPVSRAEIVRRLTDDDVNLVRVMEVDLRNPPRLRASDGLAARLCEAYPDHPLMPPAAERPQMAKWPAARLLALLFSMKARDLYGMVRAEDEPEHLQVYRRRVHDAWLVPNCATSRCHGGNSAGRFILSNAEPTSARTAYTNLLILLGYRTADGRPLLDFEDPSKSALLGYAGPRSDTTSPHPAVQGWRATSANQRRALQSDAATWIRGMHVPPRSTYPVDFTMPGAANQPRSGGDDR